MGKFEDVVEQPAGIGPEGPETVQVHTGRPRTPATAEEWTAQQVAYLNQFRGTRTGGAVIGLLEGGAGVKAAGRALSEWERKSVLDELARLLQKARSTYPPAAVVMHELHAAWRRQWGDGERALPPREQVVKPRGGKRVASMADSPPDAPHVAAAWG